MLAMYVEIERKGDEKNKIDLKIWFLHLVVIFNVESPLNMIKY